MISARGPPNSKDKLIEELGRIEARLREIWCKEREERGQKRILLQDKAFVLERRKKNIERKLHEVLRPIILERDGYRCKACGSTENLELVRLYGGIEWRERVGKAIVRRRPPVEKLWSEENLFTLCEECHKRFDSLYGLLWRGALKVSSVNDAVQLIRSGKARLLGEGVPEFVRRPGFFDHLRGRGWKVEHEFDQSVRSPHGYEVIILKGPTGEEVVLKHRSSPTLSTIAKDIQRLKVIVGKDCHILYCPEFYTDRLSEKCVAFLLDCCEGGVMYIESTYRDEMGFVTPRFYRIGPTHAQIAQELESFLNRLGAEIKEIEKERFLKDIRSFVTAERQTSFFCLMPVKVRKFSTPSSPPPWGRRR
jgi:hypothetical protein